MTKQVELKLLVHNQGQNVECPVDGGDGCLKPWPVEDVATLILLKSSS